MEKPSLLINEYFYPKKKNIANEKNIKKVDVLTTKKKSENNLINNKLKDWDLNSKYGPCYGFNYYLF